MKTYSAEEAAKLSVGDGWWLVAETVTYIVLVLALFYEVAVAMPVAWWFYLAVILAFAVVMFGRRRSATAASSGRGPRQRRILRFSILCAIVLAAYFVPWSSRKPFLADLDRVKIGMTEPEVRQIMGRYQEGTNWPAMDGSPPSSSPSTEEGSDSGYVAVTGADGKLAFKGAIVFRHSKSGDFDADFGVVSFRDGKVVKVVFMAD